MTRKPVWLLDIDGVINAVSRQPWKHNPWAEGLWTQRKIQGFDIRVAAPVADFLRRVHEHGLAEIRWHTTWQHDALKLAEVFHLPVFTVADAPEFKNSRDDDRWWKLPAVERVLADEQRPVLWTDDDIRDEIGRDKLMELEGYGPLLMVAPLVTTGLTSVHLDTITGWLAKHQEVTT